MIFQCAANNFYHFTLIQGDLESLKCKTQLAHIVLSDSDIVLIIVLSLLS